MLVKMRRVNYLHYMLKENENSMLSKFFYAQWNLEIKDYWTVQVREDLIGFGIPEDFEWIKSRSEFSFKKLV